MTRARELAELASAYDAGGLGFRNRIINGDMRVAQRGNIAAALGFWTYGGCDRTAVLPVSFATATGTIQQVAGYGSAGYAQAVALTTTGSGSVNFEQRIESFNTYDLSGGSVTVTVRVYHDTGAPINVTQTVTKANSKDNFTSKTTLGTSTPVSVPSGVVTSLTFTLSLGASDAANGLSAQVNFAGVGAVTAKSFLVTDWQLEAGSVASPFERRDYGRELMMCQRYYESIATTTNTAAAAGQAFTNANVFIPIPFKVTKRSEPTFSFTGNYIVLTANGASAGGVLTLGGSSVDTARLNIASASGLVAGNVACLFANSSGCALNFSSEL